MSSATETEVDVSVEELLKEAFSESMPCEALQHGQNFLHPDPEEEGSWYTKTRCSHCLTEKVTLVCNTLALKLMHAPDWQLILCSECGKNTPIHEYLLSLTPK